ncbi:unnamed protein product [Durusdinium trenchii]|uniref:Uncharacterized protein n=1 Tax=Durusdinium trenchii TaxID=1381693 RepID=A0ABP0JE72_9DINO
MADAARSPSREKRDSPDSTHVQVDRAASPRPRRFPKSIRGRKFVPAKKIPEDWEEILDLVAPPPPPPVTGGVRVFSVKPRDGEVNALGLKEPSHRADWTIRRLKVDLKTLQVKYWNLFVPAGQYISSAYFQIGEDTASMRFWPNGYFGKATRKNRMRTDLGSLEPDSWCAIGLVMPEGTKFKFRFRVGNHWSDVRTCHWQAMGSVMEQIWAPPQQEPGDLKNLVVGIEVLQDLKANPLPGLTSMAKGRQSSK